MRAASPPGCISWRWTRFWYIDPQRGLDGVWMNSLASDKPIYNADFTEMTVKLRPGIFWSDGVEFTSADVVFTAELHMKTNGMRWSAPFQINVASVSAPDRNTVVFKLKKPNSRFHALFTVRWNAVWMMPKHVFEKVADPLKFDFNKPVSLGAYVLHSYDPNGKWFIWQMRDDWQRTTLGRYGQPGPKYVAYVDPGPPDKRVIAQMNHELDIIHDTSAEGMFTLAKQSKTSRGWFKGFPYAHPDPTLPSVIFNHQNPLFKDRRVRWALALLIDIKAVSMASYRGAATISAIAIPPTGTHTESYHAPMEAWLKDFELDTGKRKIKPYNPEVGKEIAEMLRPSMGDQIPKDPKEIAKSFGTGWWKPNPQAATELLQAAGFTKRGGDWYTPDGKVFTVQDRGRRRGAAGDDARRLDDRAAMAAIRHRRQDRRRAGHAERPPGLGGFRHHHLVERRDLGRPSRPVVLPRQLAFAIRVAARQAADAAQLAALVLARARQDHRADPHGRLRRSEEPRTGARIREAHGAGNADHSADGLQRLHGDGRDLLEGLSERGDRPLYRPGAELGELAGDDGQAQAREVMTMHGGGGLALASAAFLGESIPVTLARR